ncbi:MAG: methyltransferase [Planctomycetes bacterium]|nr:methyltransferase [Planctomycetota bacterium]
MIESDNDIRNDIHYFASVKDMRLEFITTWGLFSPRSMDEGTRLLIKNLPVGDNAKCLDVGCGYGPIGISMAKQAPNGSVHMVDKDFVAVEYATRNAEKNGLKNTSTYLSNGLSNVNENNFDIITSNLPAKVGNEMLTIIMEDAKDKLVVGGKLVVVTISGLRGHIKRRFNDIMGNYEKVKQGKTYTVSMAIKQ